MPQPSLCLQTALYIRLSVEDNKKHGQSIDNQKLILEDFIARRPELAVYGTYIDNGATGTNFQRPGFQQMLSDIEAGHINCVVVKDLSRLGRNSIDTGYYIERYFQARQVRFIAVTDQFDTAEPNNLHGGIMLPLKNMINEAYALDIGRKIKAQARQAMKDGDYVGGRAPYGYRKDPQNCHRLLVDDEAAAVVRQIFQWAYERAGLNDIVRRLNEQGIPAPSHYKKATGEITHENLLGTGKWQTRTVAKILESEVYTGDLVQGKTKTVDHRQMKAGEDNYIIARNTHEAIVSHAMFDEVQAYRQQVREESLKQSATAYTPNILKGKVFCSHCGGSLHRQREPRKKGPDVYRFHCLSNSRTARGSCEGVSIKEDELLSAVTAILEKKLAAILDGSVSLLRLENRQTKMRSKLKADISAHRSEIEKCRKLIRGLYENLVQNVLTKAEYLEMKTAYEERISVLSAGIAECEKSLADMDAQLEQYKKVEQDAKSLEHDRTLTAALIERLIGRIDVSHDKEINVSFRFNDEFETHRKVAG